MFVNIPEEPAKISQRRVLIAEYLHEICSFNPVPTRYSDFYVNQGEQVLKLHRSIRAEIGGALSVFDSVPEIELVPTFSARGITSGGVIPAEDYARIESEWVATLRNAGPVDGAYFCLHGATAAKGEDDPEGRLLEIARDILGKSIPFVASFDLHGVLTDRMLKHCDAITVYHTYPHVDFFETGERAARLLVQLLDKKIHPVIAKVELPALVRGDELITESGLFGRLIAQAQEIQKGPRGLSAGFFIGNPFTDVPELRSYAVVVTDNDPELARTEAVRLAENFWEHRQRMQAQLVPLSQAVQQALESKRQVALVDAADATSSGASGDSVEILRELLSQGCERTMLVPVVDAPAVEAAFAAGVGATIQVDVGGTLDQKRFQSVSITAQVRLLSDGRIRSESFGQEWNSGRTAVLQAGPVTLVVSSRPVHLFDRSLFLSNGQDPRNFEITIVKSPHCQKHMYADWCQMINVDAPGSTSANVPTLGHVQCRRPVFPLDPEVQWQPQAKTFSR
ncbi:M81 family metallopeptidase [Planctomicrobium sp. SH661]|uniref:M81 family metallopeptidase n=1 Tax=Planctomicrobium sp. SH661 TaxID=3448124 RepID=UPI003F5C1221